MFWIQISTFILFNLLILAMLAAQIPTRKLAFSTGQHAGGGEGSYTVWHLIADIESETRCQAPELDAVCEERPHIPQFPTIDPDAPTGRHHLRRQTPVNG